MDGSHFRQILDSNPMNKRTGVNLKSYPDGIDCVWIAADRAGNLGAFITAGMGPIPSVALDFESKSIYEIEAEICLLPVSSTANLLVSVKRPDDYIDFAERGLFVYDWTDVTRTKRESLELYEQVAMPSMPLKLDSLPSNIFSIAESVIFAEILFSGSRTLDVPAFFECVK